MVLCKGEERGASTCSCLETHLPYHPKLPQHRETYHQASHALLGLHVLGCFCICCLHLGFLSYCSTAFLANLLLKRITFHMARCFLEILPKFGPFFFKVPIALCKHFH